VILLDANILLYAYDSRSPRHEVARAWFEVQLNGTAPVLFSWHTLTAFLRIATNPRAVFTPMSIAEASDCVDAWLARSVARVVQPTARHWLVLRRLLVEAQAPATLVPDAHLAALAIEHGALLCSTDQDFARFPGLRWQDPLRDV
jgi:toxin-antitoxin system PIN domain toxin